jgi:hypothetical protein
MQAFPQTSEKPKNGFDGDPRGHGSLRTISRGNKPPAADGFHRPLVQSKADTLNDANILRTSIRAHKNL